ncbi:hypothetical protein TNCV_1544811 [Trichonephila clavipes]|nr:hypothetical protein TNCV_1544811 [Trichonephila clavipes]
MTLDERKLDESGASRNRLYLVSRRRVEKSNRYQRRSPAVERKAAGRNQTQINTTGCKKEKTLEGKLGEHPTTGDSHPSSPFINLTRGLAARQLLRVSTCRKGTIHLQTSMPSARFKPRPYGTAVSVTNHYIRWVAHQRTKNIDLC